MKDNYKLIILLSLCLVVASLFLFLGLTADNYQYFLSRRIPKVLAIVVAGVAIAQSSLVFQTITHNRILTPSVMGFDFMYQFIQVFIILVFGGVSSFVVNDYWNFALATSVMIGCSLSLFMFYFRKGVSQANLLTLLLLGVVIGQVFNNLGSFIIMLMDPNDFSAVQASLFASFNNANVGLVYLATPILIVLCILLFIMHRLLDVFWLDTDNAISLGVNVQKVTRNILLLSAVLVSVSTALVGPLLFFGLLVTNLTREWFNTHQHKVLLIACSAMSVFALLGGQWLIEKVFEFQTTLSVVINFIGGIYFLMLIMRNKVV